MTDAVTETARRMQRNFHFVRDIICMCVSVCEYHPLCAFILSPNSYYIFAAVI